MYYHLSSMMQLLAKQRPYFDAEEIIRQSDLAIAALNRKQHLANYVQVRQTDAFAPAMNREIAIREAGKIGTGEVIAMPFGWELVPTKDQTVLDLEASIKACLEAADALRAAWVAKGSAK